LDVWGAREGTPDMCHGRGALRRESSTVGRATSCSSHGRLPVRKTEVLRDTSAALGDQFPVSRRTFLYVLVRLSVLNPADSLRWTPDVADGRPKADGHPKVGWVFYIRSSCHVPVGIRSRDLQYYAQVAFRVSYSWSRDQLQLKIAHTEGYLFILVVYRYICDSTSIIPYVRARGCGNYEARPLPPPGLWRKNT
jgi:hypothetical protein